MKAKSRLNDGSTAMPVLWLGSLLFLLFCVIFPLACVFLMPTSNDFKSVFVFHRFDYAIKNTAILCVCSSTLSVVVGYIFAYAVVAAKIPFARFFSIIPVIHLVTPPTVGGLAFILLMGRNGFITSTLLHLDVSLYGFWGIVAAEVLCFFPMAYLICAENLRENSKNLCDAAKGMGAKNWYVFWTVTFPLSFPGIAGAALFVAASVLSDFGNPMIVGGRFKVLSVEIYSQLSGWLNAGTSALLGILLLIPSTVLFLAQRKVLKENASKIATIGGKSLFSTEENFSQSQVSPSARIALTVFCAFCALLIIFQFVAIVAGSFQEIWGIKTNFTTSHIKNTARFSKEIFNSIGFSLSAAIFSTFLSCVTSFFVHRTAAPLSRFFDTAIQIPAAVPGTLFGLAFSVAAARLNIRLPRMMIFIAISVGFMPFSYRIISTTFAEVKTTLDDAARSLGQSEIGVLRTILCPICLKGIFCGFVYNFARGIGTLSAVIFLVSFNTPLASVAILNLSEQGSWGDSAALALVLTLVTFLILGVGEWLIFRFEKRNS